MPGYHPHHAAFLCCETRHDMPPLCGAQLDLAVCTGQRRGDLLALKRDQLSGEGITFKQSKTATRVLIEWSKDLEAIIARAKAMSPQIPAEYLLRKHNGRPYTEDGFSAIWQRLMVKYAEAGGVRFSALASTTCAP